MSWFKKEEKVVTPEKAVPPSRTIKVKFTDASIKVVEVAAGCLMNFVVMGDSIILYICNSETKDNVAVYTGVKYYEVTV
jgi:hypothetical protein